MSNLKNLSVEGTVILVTGGTSGIGKVVTSTLCAQGASVVFTGRNETAGDAILTDLRNTGHEEGLAERESMILKERQTLENELEKNIS